MKADELLGVSIHANRDEKDRRWIKTQVKGAEWKNMENGLPLFWKGSYVIGWCETIQIISIDPNANPSKITNVTGSK